MRDSDFISLKYEYSYKSAIDDFFLSLNSLLHNKTNHVHLSACLQK